LDRIKKDVASDRTPVPKPPSKTTAEMLKERTKLEGLAERKDNKMDTGQAKMMRTMFEKMSTKNNPQAKEMMTKMFGEVKLPDLCAEYMKHRAWPPGIDPTYGTSFLTENYETHTMLPGMFELAFEKDGTEVFAEEDYIKRLNGNHSMKWYYDNCVKSRNLGAVFDMEKEQPHFKEGYFMVTSHFFSNQAYRKEMLTAGKVHVAVGFVDLGLLLVSDLTSNASSVSSKATRFVGIERSAYCVAKTLVIWSAMKKSSVLPRDRAKAIVQLWWSATWEKSTLALFRECVKDVLLKSGDLTPEVRSIVVHWDNAGDVSLRRARDVWKKLTNDICCSAHLQKLEDRLDASAYGLTGDFALSSLDQLVGSTLLCDLPDGTPPFELNISIYGTVSHVITACDALRDGTSLMRSIENSHEANVTKLLKWVDEGKISVTLLHADVSESIPMIVSMHPHSMSWSNLPDYFGYRKFHALARSCSVGGDTIHFAYSMN
jgi:hypothetical protein